MLRQLSILVKLRQSITREAKVSNRDESNTKSSQARPAQQKNDIRQTLPVLETNQAKYFRQKVETGAPNDNFRKISVRKTI